MREAGAAARGVWFALATAACTPDVELVHAPDAAPLDARPAPRWTAVASGTSSNLRAVWGTGASDVWAVGEGGTAIHWDGAAWRALSPATSTTWNAVWAARPDDVWIVGVDPDGTGVVKRWDGTRWADAPSPGRARATLRAVWGTSSADVWVVASGMGSPEPNLWHWDGSGWRPEIVPGGRAPSLTAIRGVGVDDVWAVGEGPLLLHRSGGTWSVVAMPVRDVMFGGALCVTPEGAVWVTSSTNAAWRYAAATWAEFALDSAGAARGLWCARGDVWAVGDGARAWRWEGAAWVGRELPRPDLAAVWGSGATDLWAVGAQGATVRYGL